MDKGTFYLDAIKAYNRREGHLTKGKCALLIIDAQKYFTGVLTPIMPNIVKLQHAFRHLQKDDWVPIIYTRHGHKSLEDEKDGGMLANWWGEGIIKGSDEWDFVSTLDVSESCHKAGCTN